TPSPVIRPYTTLFRSLVPLRCASRGDEWTRRGSIQGCERSRVPIHTGGLRPAPSGDLQRHLADGVRLPAERPLFLRLRPAFPGEIGRAHVCTPVTSSP